MVCEKCGDPWGIDGCAVVRTLKVLVATEGQRDAKVEEIGELTAALADVATRPEWWRTPSTMTVEFRLKVDDCLGGLVRETNRNLVLIESLKKLYEQAARHYADRTPQSAVAGRPSPDTAAREEKR